MKKIFISILLLMSLAAAALLIGGCSAKGRHTAPSVDAEPAEAMPVSFSENNPAPDADSPSPADEDTNDAAAAAQPQDYCLGCHTDQQALIDTAKPEEPAATESKGEG